MKVDILVRDAMSRSVLKVAPEESVLSVAIKMREKNIGSAIVISPEGKVLGMITERDIAFKIVPEKKDPSVATALEIMTSPVVSIEDSVDLVSAAETMRNHGFRRLPVTDQSGNLVGIVTQTDVADVGPELINLFKRLLSAKEASKDQISQHYQEKKAKEELDKLKKELIRKRA